MRNSFKSNLAPHESLATLAGGCFWGMEDLIRKTRGVLRTQVGYIGGQPPSPTYTEVKTGKTGHAEAIEIVFDQRELSYEALLEFFFKIHDPTTKDRQGGDIGSQYRSEIFVHNSQQRDVATQVIARIEASRAWTKPLVTAISDAPEFWPAEEYHQDYLEKNPDGYTCHFVRPLSF